MARTTLTKSNAPGNYSSTGAVLTFATADAVNGNDFLATGNELVLARNTSGANTYYVTVSSVNDPYNRKGDINQYNIPANGYAVFGPFPRLGWMQPDGKIYIDVENAAVELAVIVLP